MNALVAALPIVVVFVLLVAFRWPAIRAMSVTFLLMALVALGYWKVPPGWMAAAVLEGIVIAIALLYIIFGALFLLYVQKHSGAVEVIRRSFRRISPDRRIQAVVIAWGFGGFIEGAAGFGTPAAVAGPLLVILGFPPMAAAVSTLIIQSMPVSFGALGTPFYIGVQKGLENQPSVIQYLATTAEVAGLPAIGDTPPAAAGSSTGNLENLLYQIGVRTAFVQACVGWAIPLIMVCILTRFFGRNRSWREGLEVWPFACVAGIVYAGTYLTCSFLLGPRFPTIIGGLVTVGLTAAVARLGWLQPRRPWDFPAPDSWPTFWGPSEQKSSDCSGGSLMPAGSPGLGPLSSPSPSQAAGEEKSPGAAPSTSPPPRSDPGFAVFPSQGERIPDQTEESGGLALGEGRQLPEVTAFLPYLGVAFLLLVEQWPPVKAFLSRLAFPAWELARAEAGRAIVAQWNLAASPGTVLLIVALLAILLQKVPSAAVRAALGETLRRLVGAAAALFFAVAAVRIFIHSGVNTAELPSMPQALAQAVAEIAGTVWPAFAAAIGALGAFIAGSATVSNMTFSLFQFELALRTGLDPRWIVGLQVVGAAAGNMVCVHNVVAASATVGLVGKEGLLIRRTLLPTIYYLVAAGILGLLLTWIF
jgi:lactate permease